MSIRETFGVREGNTEDWIPVCFALAILAVGLGLVPVFLAWAYYIVVRAS